MTQSELENAITVLSHLRPDISESEAYSDQSKSEDRKKPVAQKHIDRLNSSLDALASICISTPGQVVATTISITASRVRLFVSSTGESSDGEPSLVHYLSSIWTSLQEISRSRLTPDFKIIPAIDTTGAAVYERCHPKLFQIVNKRFEDFKRFSAFTNQLGYDTPRLFDIAEQLIGLLSMMQSEASWDSRWEIPARAFDAGYMELQDVLKDERWLKNVSWQYSKQSPSEGDPAVVVFSMLICG